MDERELFKFFVIGVLLEGKAKGQIGKSPHL